MTIELVKRWENPYKKRLGDFAGRIYSLTDDESEYRSLIDYACGCSKPLIVELGSGSGAHLIELARRNPNAEVIGFELRFKRAVRTIEKANEICAENCYVVRKSYDDFSTYFPAGSIERLYVNFPDPWSKKRWLKHRILGSMLLSQLPQVLQPTGKVLVKTDHREYFMTFVEELKADSRFRIIEYSLDLYQSEYAENSIPTEFERLFRRQGLPIHYLQFELAS